MRERESQKTHVLTRYMFTHSLAMVLNSFTCVRMYVCMCLWVYALNVRVFLSIQFRRKMKMYSVFFWLRPH